MRSSCGFLGEGGAQVRRGRGAKKGELRGAALAGQGRAAPRQPRKVGPPTSVGQQPGPIARFAGVGRRRKRRLGGLATAQEHAHAQASRTSFVGCSLIFYYSRFCIRLHFRARTVVTFNKLFK